MTRARRCSPQAVRVLAALLQEPQAWRHGYELLRVAGLKAGTLYPILKRLSGRGLLESRWQGPSRPGRPSRQVHRLTSRGLTFVRSQHAAAAASPPLGRP
jgi:DNA-binding PadR family transcriptional regulator